MRNWKNSIDATLHCLSGCALGEVAGMVIGTALGLSNFATVILAISLAFFFGYALTMKFLLSLGLTFKAAAFSVFMADTASIALMEIVDNLIMLSVPEVMDAGLRSALFWGALIFSLGVAFLAALPLNHWLIQKGKGHAFIHVHHEHE